MNSQITCFLILLSGAALFFCQGCFELEGSDQPYVPSPRAIVHTPAGTSGGDVTITFQLIDRECDTGDVALAYSTDGGQSFNAATLVNPGDATGLETDIYPGKLHVVAWNSAGDGVGVSGSINVCVRVTPSDAGNPSGSLGISGLFLVDNTAYNQPPAVTAATPAGVQSGNVQISYFLSDVESDTCSIQVHFSADNGATWDGATMGPAGEGVTGLASSPSGSAHVYRWNSGADGVAPSGQIDIVRIRITPLRRVRPTARRWARSRLRSPGAVPTRTGLS